MKRLWTVGVLLCLAGLLVLGTVGCSSSPDKPSYEKTSGKGKKPRQPPYRSEGSGGYSRY